MGNLLGIVVAKQCFVFRFFNVLSEDSPDFNLHRHCNNNTHLLWYLDVLDLMIFVRNHLILAHACRVIMMELERNYNGSEDLQWK